MHDPVDLLTVSDVARILNVTPDTVRHMERNGKLRAFARVGKDGWRLFKSEDVESLRSKRASGEERVGNRAGTMKHPDASSEIVTQIPRRYR